MAKINHLKRIKQQDREEELRKEVERKQEKCYGCVWGSNHEYKFSCMYKDCVKDKLL